MANADLNSIKLSTRVPKRQNSEIHRIFRILLRRKFVSLSLIILLIFIGLAIFAPYISQSDPYAQNLTERLKAPSAEHWLGTDSVGRDVLSRVIYGSRISLVIGLSVVFIAGLFGGLLGMISGFFGGIIDTLIMRFFDAMMAIPPIMLALVLGASVGGGLKGIIIALSVAQLPAFARIMRGQVLTVKESDYITATKADGASNLRLMFFHVLPNSISPMIVLATVNIGIAILVEGGLSFLGLGIEPPLAAWGSLVKGGYPYLLSNPILSFAPGLCITIIVLSFNIVGDALRDALDPRLRGIN